MRKVAPGYIGRFGIVVIFGVMMIGGLIVLTSDVDTGLSPGGIALVIAYAVLMLGVCMLASVVPTTRALRIESTGALRSD